ncbi:MAG: MGMT family protein [Gammaproteobacteria bacterium]
MPSSDRQTAGPTPLEEAYARIWAVVRRIPRGRVATYGQIAALAGFVRRPRLGGQAMRHAPADPKLPWHRVINAQGRISLPAGSSAAREQQRRLEAEGVRFIGTRIDLGRHRWRPGSDAPLLD